MKDFKLGFGLMRLPKKPGGAIDLPQTMQMADAFLAAGGTHFDTAYIYDRGESEKAFRLAVAERIPVTVIRCPRSCAHGSSAVAKQTPSSNSSPAWNGREPVISTSISCMPFSGTTTRNTMSTISGISSESRKRKA